MISRYSIEHWFQELPRSLKVPQGLWKSLKVSQGLSGSVKVSQGPSRSLRVSQSLKVSQRFHGQVNSSNHKGSHHLWTHTNLRTSSFFKHFGMTVSHRFRVKQGSYFGRSFKNSSKTRVVLSQKSWKSRIVLWDGVLVTPGRHIWRNS